MPKYSSPILSLRPLSFSLSSFNSLIQTISMTLSICISFSYSYSVEEIHIFYFFQTSAFNLSTGHYVFTHQTICLQVLLLVIRLVCRFFSPPILFFHSFCLVGYLFFCRPICLITRLSDCLFVQFISMSIPSFNLCLSISIHAGVSLSDHQFLLS